MQKRRNIQKYSKLIHYSGIQNHLCNCFQETKKKSVQNNQESSFSRISKLLQSTTSSGRIQFGNNGNQIAPPPQPTENTPIFSSKQTFFSVKNKF
jgi:hypothetical protein